MIDNFTGEWTYEPNTPENKKCDMDRIADWIIQSGYKVKTTIENLVIMIILYFDSADNYGEYDESTGFGGYGDYFTVEECKRYVEDTDGGISFYDYYA